MKKIVKITTCPPLALVFLEWLEGGICLLKRAQGLSLLALPFGNNLEDVTTLPFRDRRPEPAGWSKEAKARRPVTGGRDLPQRARSPGPMSLGLEVSALTDSGEHTDVQTNQISPVMYGTSSLWGCCPAYQSLHHIQESQKKFAQEASFS